MNIFTANQVNQVYVIPAGAAFTNAASKTPKQFVDDDTNFPKGSVYVGKTKEGELYFIHKGANGSTRTDIIPEKLYYKIAYAEEMVIKNTTAKVTVNSEAYTSTTSGGTTTYTMLPQDYILNVEFQNPMGMSPDNKYFATAAVHASSSMELKTFYLKMASSLAKNIGKLGGKNLIKVYVAVSTTKTEITPESDPNDTSTYSGAYDSIVLEGAEPDWIRGIKQIKPVVFKVLNSVVTKSNDDVYWVDVIYSNGQKVTGGSEIAETIDTSNAPAAVTIPNGKLMADYEYFYHGERGDQYRMKTWPDYIPTKYMISESDAEDKTYDTLGIHFAYVGSNHAIQKSEKDITFIVQNTSTTSEGTTTNHVLLTSFIAAINAVMGSGYITDPHN